MTVFGYCRRLAIALAAAALVAGCSSPPDTVTFHADDNPEKLSAWGLFATGNGRITPRPGMITYELQTPLFSDYAQKWRTIWMPKGASARYRPDSAFDFPVGTIVTKTFYYTTPAGAADPQTSATVVRMTPATYQTGVGGLDLRHVRLIETRLLIRRAGGWVALPYVWDADGKDATLARAGADIPLTLDAGPDVERPLDKGSGQRISFGYAVPNQNQCAGCHAQDYRTRAISPIGLKARHLNFAFAGEGGTINQLTRLVNAAYLTGLPGTGIPQNANWQDPAQPLMARARAYLDINCSHCHNAQGPARTSGLWLDPQTQDPRLFGQCKPPVAAGRGTGDRPFDIVPGRPDRSILVFRLTSTDPGVMMPELGRDLVHDEGVALVTQDIAALKGECVVDRGPPQGARP